jgi:methionyl-tRNA formyltransferase
VAEAARALGIQVDQPESVNSEEARSRMLEAGPEAVCICAYGAIIAEPLLSEHELLNVHPSLLPRWRGAAPIERAIQAGDLETGVSIMRPTAELDAGPVHLQRSEPIHPADDYGSLAARLSVVGGELLVEVLDTHPEPRCQPADGITYAEKIDREERRLDPATTAAVLARTVRALNPHVGTYVEPKDGERLGVRRAAPVTGGVEPGSLAARNGRLLFGVADGALELIEVLPPGGRAMSAADYLRGRAPTQQHVGRGRA